MNPLKKKHLADLEKVHRTLKKDIKVKNMDYTQVYYDVLKNTNHLLHNLIIDLKKDKVEKESKITLRDYKLFEPGEAEFILRLRNEKEARENSLNQNKIALKEHKNWIKDKTNQYRIIQYNNEPLGYLRKENGEISICIDKDYRGKGIATDVLKQQYGTAIIKIENKFSLNAFINAGFKIVGFYLEKK